MNTSKQFKPKLHLKASYIGPIMSLDSNLSEERQNLIFATNGTGKSFLSRAFRLLDQYRDDQSSIEASDIVSEESTSGTFSILEDAVKIADVKLDTNTGSSLNVSPEHLFHVFSADYVESELKRKSYHELDGTTNHEIILGKPNAELIEKQDELTKKQADYGLQRNELREQFEKDKETMKKNFAITASLSEFKSLDLLKVIASEAEVTDDIDTLKAQYEKIKSLPEGASIGQLAEVDSCFLDPSKMVDGLQKTVTPAAIDEKFKQKILADPDFFKIGIKKLSDDPDHCHFCTQEIQATALAAISVYREYFEDEEASLQEVIIGLKNILKTLKSSISTASRNCLSVQASYNELKIYFPDLTIETLESVEDKFDLLNDEYTMISGILDQKSQDLTKPQNIDWVSRLAGIETTLQATIQSNNVKLTVLSDKLAKAGKQKQDIQRAACISMREAFRAKKESALENLKSLEISGKALVDEIAQLKKISGDKVSARDKVADTFEYLLGFVFGKKYTFDVTRFVVQRNKSDMTRGGDRTLSEGEKSVLGFCYYLAQTHLKVAEVDDYKKLFFIIDDPVSSVSFDYIYSIAQIIKSLRLKDAELCFDSSPVQRPQMLILTHNDYFYNLASANNVVPKSALFQLTDNNGHHTLNQQKQFVAPHVAHMKEVLDVASANKTPNHQTANSIRCVLEGMWRFCKPDLDDLGAFVSFASNTLGIEIKSMLLLNNLSHGAKMYSDATFETDIVIAAKEVLEIVQKLAPGQVKKVA